MEVGGHDVAIPFYMLTVGAGEVISLLYSWLYLIECIGKMRNVILRMNKCEGYKNAMSKK